MSSAYNSSVNYDFGNFYSSNIRFWYSSRYWFTIRTKWVQEGFIPFEDFNGGESEGTSEWLQPRATDELSLSEAYLTGNRFGIVLGSQNGAAEGANARNSSLPADPRISYREPTDFAICDVFVRYMVAPLSQNTSLTICREPPPIGYATTPMMSEFFEGFAVGYEIGYSWGYYTTFLLALDQPSQTQPPAQSPTQQSPILPPLEEALSGQTQQLP